MRLLNHFVFSFVAHHALDSKDTSLRLNFLKMYVFILVVVKGVVVGGKEASRTFFIVKIKLLELDV